MNKIHIWIGSTSLDEEEYNAYFKIDYSTGGDFDDPEYTVCRFCEDLGEQWYDEDFIGISPIYKHEIPVKDMLEHNVPIHPHEIKNAVEECDKAGIKTANALFYLTDPDIIIHKPYKEQYNGLTYIGVYNTGE
jgi:hypothetical protein